MTTLKQILENDKNADFILYKDQAEVTVRYSLDDSKRGELAYFSRSHFEKTHKRVLGYNARYTETYGLGYNASGGLLIKITN